MNHFAPRFLLAVFGAILTNVVWAAPFAYVPNEKSGTISVIDSEKDEVIATIKAGDTWPTGDRIRSA